MLKASAHKHSFELLKVEDVCPSNKSRNVTNTNDVTPNRTPMWLASSCCATIDSCLDFLS